MFSSRFMPCPDCGDSVDTSEPGHECSPERWAEFQMFRLRDEVAQLRVGFERYLETTVGRFESWSAARQVRGGS